MTVQDKGFPDKKDQDTTDQPKVAEYSPDTPNILTNTYPSGNGAGATADEKEQRSYRLKSFFHDKTGMLIKSKTRLPMSQT